MDGPQTLGYFSLTLSRFDRFIREKDNFATILAVEYFLFFLDKIQIFFDSDSENKEK
jgi:hypothetical protein